MAEAFVQCGWMRVREVMTAVHHSHISEASDRKLPVPSARMAEAVFNTGERCRDDLEYSHRGKIKQVFDILAAAIVPTLASDLVVDSY